ncbi:L,D-transpeptidase family protein [Hymenobacter lutimineralis]|uniref:L,D-transpeptidase family protein n=1 Tax=Hymenobacter lutimineralis TaxID=2606448 RepID=A0A5D6USD9_9BACT|nr:MULTISPECIES: L,D-transpeptidase family protein [Hymenobacter]QIX59994.1 L,D-transpeptidase family protein [Hymenobacter sp. BT18]TYZ06621.1 L,D-transpeptidase family protein [Hymenobacter lutimineralis]
MKVPVVSVFFSTLLSWLLCLTLLATAASCSQDQQNKMKAALPGTLGKPGGPQPKLDSVYVVRQMLAEPAFKDQLEWGKKFYRERDFRLGWFRGHELVPQAKTMLSVINKAGEEGLDPKDYKVKDFDKLFAELEAAQMDTTKRNALEKQIDVALSGTYFNWASDFYRGTVNPREVKSIDWQVKRNKIKLHKALMTILKERESTYPYYEFEPLHPEYDRLKKALADYRELQRQGGWAQLPATTKLKPGDSSPTVELLQQRLLNKPAPATAQAVPVSNGGASAAPAPKYDGELVAAVKEFQELNGLKPDGVVGGETLKQLNVPIQSRIEQITLNMERWRWIPKRFEADYLLVNIPDYKLHVIEDNKEVFDMRVIVGKALNATPVFSDKMEYVVLAPYWNVPYSIIDKEMRANLTNNPVGTLDRLDMEVVKGSGAKATPIDPTSVDWANLTEKTWKYTLRRRPGPKNDLGDVKFIFPNSNDVYLHDTPHDELFNQTKRGFSHGCVRVEEPIKLAEYLLRNKSGYDEAKILDVISQRKEQYVALPEKLPVYLVYFTSWVDEAGKVHFREDIYGHDKSLAREYFD